MVRLFKKMSIAVASAGLMGAGALAVAPPAAAFPTDCEIVHEAVPHVIDTANALQTAAQVKGWKWTDPDIQNASNKTLTMYPFWLFDGLADLPTRSAIFDRPNGDYVGDANNLVAAMNEQMSTVRNADTPADVLPDVAATLAAADALQSDCDGVN